ncbi:MAG: MMPL family transporter [Gemmatimonadetes bacterium]|nr:MMPL family transporter [Gemmatimonadota bacterium]
MLPDLVHFLVRYRVLGALAVLLLAISMGVLATGLSVDNSLEVWFVEDDPTLAAYQAFLEEYGSDELVVIAIHGSDDLFSPDRLERLARLTEVLEDIDGVARVHSLANTGTLLPGGDPRLVPAVDLPVGLDDQMRARAVVSIDGLASQLVGRDGTTLVVFAWMGATRDIDVERPRILDAIRSATLAELDLAEHASFGGVGVLHDALNRATIGEGSLFIGLSYLVIAVALLLITRRWLWTILALLVVTAADVVLLGLMSFLGHPVNMITIALPPVVMILGVANVVHMATDLDIAISHGRSSLSELEHTLAEVTVPCAFNALTTAVAFLSLTAASMAVTRDYGLFAAIGVGLAFVFSVAGMSALLPQAARLRRPALSSERLAGAAERIMVFSLRHRAAMLLTTLLVVFISAAGARRIVVDTYSIGFLPPDNVARLDATAIEQSAGAYFPMELTLRSDGEDWMDHEFLGTVAAVQAALEADATIGRTTTIADVLRDLDVGSTGVLVPRPWAPGGDEAVDRTVTLLEQTGNGDILEHMVADDGRTLRLTATTPAMSVRSFIQLAERSRATAQAASGGQAEVSLSGYLPLYSQIIENVVADQVKSFSLAFLMVFLVVSLALRSWRFALVAIPPNVVPVAILLGFMGFAGIRLDIATVTVAAVVLGVIVDDTVHILHRLRRELDTGVDLDTAMRAVARASGLAVISTSLVFAAGFFVISLAASDAVGRSGLLMSIAVLAALVTDLLLLPAFVSLLFARKHAGA